MSQSDDFANDSSNTSPNHFSPATASNTVCPSFEELTAWLERRELQPSPAFAGHVQKCPQCAHLVALAETVEAHSGSDEGFADHDLLSIQPALRTPAPPAGKSPRAARNKGKFSAATWELLTGQPAPRRKP